MEEKQKKPRHWKAGRKKGISNKISGVSILKAIQQQTGKPFEQLLAEGYQESIIAQDMPTRIQYEKMILSKVVADKHEIDHTTLGESMHASFNFPHRELPDWSELPVTYTIDAKND